MSGRNNDSVPGCVIYGVLGLIFLPFVGLFLAVTGEDESSKIGGILLTIVGFIIWIALGIGY